MIKLSRLCCLIGLSALGCSATPASNNNTAQPENGQPSGTDPATGGATSPPNDPVSCANNSECDASAYCKLPDGKCSARGTCEVRPGACTRIYKPVCGCDGRTYGNACVAANAGASVGVEGECAPGPSCGGLAGRRCSGSVVCVDDPSDRCDPSQGGRDCSGSCACPRVSPCVPGTQWDPSPTVCACVADPCFTVLCPIGTYCESKDGTARCEPGIHPCATVLCGPDTRCVVRDGVGSCEPIGHACATVLCPPGKYCVDDRGNATCESETGERCGPVPCKEGLECCNASCGICVTPGGVCTQQACN